MKVLALNIKLFMPSSVISAMKYNDVTRTLTIVYRGSRGRYHYLDVPPEEWIAFQSAPSKGTYLNQVFKTRNYRFKKVRG